MNESVGPLVGPFSWCAWLVVWLVDQQRMTEARLVGGVQATKLALLHHATVRARACVLLVTTVRSARV